MDDSGKGPVGPRPDPPLVGNTRILEITELDTKRGGGKGRDRHLSILLTLKIFPGSSPSWDCCLPSSILAQMCECGARLSQLTFL